MVVPTILNKNAEPTAPNNFIVDKVINPYLAMLQIKKDERNRYEAVVAKIKKDIDLITDAESANNFTAHIKEYEHVGSSISKARSLFSAKVSELGLVYDSDKKLYTDADTADCTDADTAE